MIDSGVSDAQHKTIVAALQRALSAEGVQAHATPVSALGHVLLVDVRLTRPIPLIELTRAVNSIPRMDGARRVTLLADASGRKHLVQVELEHANPGGRSGPGGAGLRVALGTDRETHQPVMLPMADGWMDVVCADMSNWSALAGAMVRALARQNPRAELQFLPLSPRKLLVEDGWAMPGYFIHADRADLSPGEILKRLRWLDGVLAQRASRRPHVVVLLSDLDWLLAPHTGRASGLDEAAGASIRAALETCLGREAGLTCIARRSAWNSARLETEACSSLFARGMGLPRGALALPHIHQPNLLARQGDYVLHTQAGSHRFELSFDAEGGDAPVFAAQIVYRPWLQPSKSAEETYYAIADVVEHNPHLRARRQPTEAWLDALFGDAARAQHEHWVRQALERLAHDAPPDDDLIPMTQ